MGGVTDPETGLEFYELSHPWGMYSQVKLVGIDVQALDHPLGTFLGPHGPGPTSCRSGCARPWWLSTTATFAPSVASSFAVSSPILRPAPVTMAT